MRPMNHHISHPLLHSSSSSPHPKFHQEERKRERKEKKKNKRSRTEDKAEPRPKKENKMEITGVEPAIFRLQSGRHTTRPYPLEHSNVQTLGFRKGEHCILPFKLQNCFFSPFKLQNCFFSTHLFTSMSRACI